MSEGGGAGSVLNVACFVCVAVCGRLVLRVVVVVGVCASIDGGMATFGMVECCGCVGGGVVPAVRVMSLAGCCRAQHGDGVVFRGRMDSWPFKLAWMLFVDGGRRCESRWQGGVAWGDSGG